MAATIAIARGHDTSRTKETHRLGSQSASAEVATWRTFIRVEVDREGRCYIRVSRDGKDIHTWTLRTPENATDGEQ